MDKPIKKTEHLILTLHFAIEVDEARIPIDGVNARPGGTIRTGDDSEWREMDERERRLLRVVVGDRFILESYLRQRVVRHLALMGDRDWDTIFPDDSQNHEMLIATAIKLLSSEDREYFADAEDQGVLYESTEIFDDCWKSSIVAAKLAHKNEGE